MSPTRRGLRLSDRVARPVSSVADQCAMVSPAPLEQPPQAVTTSLPAGAIGAVVARFVHTEEVTGSNPVSPTQSIGDVCPRKARTSSPASFVRLRFAWRGRGLRHPHPQVCGWRWRSRGRGCLRFARQGFAIVGPSPGRIGRVKSGSVWLVYGVAVVVTFVVGVIAFSVFVLSKVFGASAPEPGPAPLPSVQAVAPSMRVSSAPVVRVSVAKVLEVRAVVADPRQVVLIVATPGECGRNVRAAVFAEGVGAVAVRVTQEALPGCKWERKPVLAVAKAPLGERTLIVNGTPWTPGGDGYELALRADS
jgi:hypothetical protein